MNGSEKQFEKNIKRKKRGFDWQKHLFLVAIMIVPLSAFVFFEIICNINSILLAMKTFDDTKGDFFWAHPLGKNFAEVWRVFKMDGILITSIKNSLFGFVMSILLMPISVFISYAITEKVPLFGFYKIILFIPSILCTMAVATIGKNALTYLLPKILNNPGLEDALMDERQFISIWGFATFWGIAGNMVLCLGAMSGVSIDLKEYAQIDGLGRFGVLLHVVFPAIYPTLSTFAVVTLVSAFTSSGMSFVFFTDRLSREAYTLGYYLFMQTYKTRTSYAIYPYAAAVGICYTFVAAPLTLGLRAVLEKMGPKEE